MIPFLNFDHLKAHQELSKLASSKKLSLSALLDTKRLETCQVNTPLGAKTSLSYNYAAKLVDNEVLAALQRLADESQLTQKFRELASGAMYNTGEKRKVLHHLARGQLAQKVEADGRDIGAFYRQQVQRMAEFASKVHKGEILSASGKKFDTVVQVGIGGSDLGPRALYLALKTWVESGKGSTPAASSSSGSAPSILKGRGSYLKAHFISNVDPDDAAEVLKNVNPHSTLFILVSKSGTTQETLTNEALVLNYLSKAGIASPRKQLICVTSETSPLAKSSEYLASFFIDDYIGGRYSSTSPVGGAVLSLAFGPEVFEEILAGAHEQDKAGLNPDIRQNAALLDALIGVWERNFLGFASTAVLPYSQALSRFPAHLQQADMESNGKQVNRDGQPISYLTGPVIFGEPGTNGQHSFYQLLHQGTDIIPLQFIGFRSSQDGMDVQFQGSTSQQKLNANLAAQIVAFALGSSNSNPNKHFPGERPSSLLHADELNPRVLGALLAHFENKIMFQGLVWNLNSFDQEGVQLGKVLTGRILEGKDRTPLLEAYAKLLGVL